MEENKTDNEEDNKNEDSYNRYFIYVLVIFFGYMGTLIFTTLPISEFSINKGGVFGDSFGVITSLFTGLAFAGIFITLKYQRSELALQRKDLEIARGEYKLTRDEMKQARLDAQEQATERTFYNMLNIYNDLIVNLEFVHLKQSKITQSGVRCFSCYLDSIEQVYGKLLIVGKNEDLLEKCDHIYSEFYNQHHALLGHYFRYLYRLFKYIDEETGNKSEIYSKILRSQLTNNEMALLFYNGLSHYGKKFKPLLEEYEVFDNLPTNIIKYNSLITLYDKKAWGQNHDIDFSIYE